MFNLEFRPSSAPSEHSYAEYLTIPLRPLTQRQSPSPPSTNRRRGSDNAKPKRGRRRHHIRELSQSRRSLSTNDQEMEQDIINGMYRLKLKRSGEPQFKDFPGNKTIIRKYRQKRQRHRSAKQESSVIYDSVDTTSEEENDDLVPLLEEVPRKCGTLPANHHSSSRSYRRPPKPQRSPAYDSPCRLVTMLVV